MAGRWRKGLAGLAGMGLLAAVTQVRAGTDDASNVQQQIEQLREQLNSQKAEIGRLQGDLERTRRVEAARLRRLSYANPALDGSTSATAKSAAAGSGSGAGSSGGSAKKDDKKSEKKEDVNSAIAKYLKEHPSKPTAGYDKAFFIRNPDGPQIFYFDFKFQNWFDDIQSDPNNPPLGSSTLTPRQNSGTDTIRFRREELHFFGNLTDHIGWKIMIDPSRAIGVDETAAQTNRILQDIFLTYTPYSWLGFKFGQFRVPQTMEGFWQDSGNLDFPEETLMTRSFGDVRDTGLQAYGKPFDGILEYYVGVFSGARQNRTRDENNQKDLREWVAIHPLARYIAQQKAANALALKQDPSCNPEEPFWKELMIGISRRDGVEGSELFGTYHGDATNVFADAEFGRFIARGEWSQGKGLNARSVTFDPNGLRQNELLTKNAEGWYVTLGYNLTNKWQPMVRHEEYSRDRNEPHNLVRITTVGVNYYLFGKDDYDRIGAHRMEVQAAYNFDHSPPNAHYFVGNEFTVNVQVAF